MAGPSEKIVLLIVGLSWIEFQANYSQAQVALPTLTPPPRSTCLHWSSFLTGQYEKMALLIVRLRSTCPHWSSFWTGQSEKLALLIVGLSWIESVPKCSSPSSMAPDKILGIFGDAELSARAPRPCFKVILMISTGYFLWIHLCVRPIICRPR